VFVERAWAKAHEDALVRYLAAHIDAQRWMMDPKNRTEAIVLLAGNLKVDSDDATRIYENHLRTGWPKDGAFDRTGFENVLILRAEVEGSWGGKPPEAARYVDLSYYEKALKLAAR
jgi:ABC-type nitrate/sulfonate/bicarbonate transport system substrate-binding protein